VAAEGDALGSEEAVVEGDAGAVEADAAGD
jgi:hypothetical protein